MPEDTAALARHKEMMTRGEDVPVTLVTHDGKRTPGHLRRLRLTEAEASGRAGKWLVVCLAIAPVTFIFPPHIPWPLAAVATGVIGYLARRNRRELILGGEATCPQCGASQVLDGGNAEFPMAHFCTGCRERSLVELA